MFLVLLLLLVISACSKPELQRFHHVDLSEPDGLRLDWLVDDASGSVRFTLSNPFTADRPYFALGFTKWGRLKRSDRVQFYRSLGRLVVEDQYVDDSGQVHVDMQQDWTVTEIEENLVGLERKIDTCDPQDLPFNNGTIHLQWLRSTTQNPSLEAQPPPPHSSDHHAHSSHPSGPHSGSTLLQLLRSVPIVPETNSHTLDVRVHNYSVPLDNIYLCKIVHLPQLQQRRRHLVQFEPIITHPGLLHHMELFHCVDGRPAQPQYEGDCGAAEATEVVRQCAHVVSLWALGSEGFTYPPEAGVPLGGPNFSPYFRLEVHYNNADNRSGLIDNSGLRLRLIDRLRRYDVGIMELGLEYTDKMMIPPGQIAFPLTGYCAGACTRAALPEGGIWIFGDQLHTHARGVRVLTRHFRDGVELGTVGRDDYYVHEFQEIRNLAQAVHVLPGDDLITTCYYDTTQLEEPMYGGFTAHDEMCVNYVHYYPDTNLELCKSSVGEKALEEFFEWHEHIEHNPAVQSGGARSANYAAIDWRQPRHVDQLFALYTHAPLSMQCNRSDGHRFPGEWEALPPIAYQLTVAKSHPDASATCPDYNPFEVVPLEQGECGYMGDCVY